MILDTNALSAFAEGAPGILARLVKAQQPAVPVIVLGEYRFGIAQSRRKAEYESWLREVLPVCKVLEVTQETSVEYAEVRLELKRAATPIPANDVWIAALCRQHALPLLSQDEHFDLVEGVRRLSW